MKLFSWLLHHDRLWCNDWLQCRGWSNSYFCQLCLRNLQTSFHLLWECKMSDDIWKEAATWQGCNALNPTSWSNDATTTAKVQDIIRRAAPGQERKGIKSILILISWEIWQERNNCIFRWKSPRAADVISKIRSNMKLWHLAGAKCFEHPSGDMIGRS